MKGGTIVLSVVLVIVVVLGIVFAGSYNGLVKAEEAVNAKYADIDTQLQRRSDLIPNLVNTVKGYAAHEQAAIEAVTTARENLLKANGTQELANADAKLTEAINNLLVIVENYPDLKANTNFIQLQDELAGTENRIAVARKNYNEAVEEYNANIRTFPRNILAGLFGFDKKEYFKAAEGTQIPPQVDFE